MTDWATLVEERPARLFPHTLAVGSEAVALLVDGAEHTRAGSLYAFPLDGGEAVLLGQLDLDELVRSEVITRDGGVTRIAERDPVLPWGRDLLRVSLRDLRVHAEVVDLDNVKKRAFDATLPACAYAGPIGSTNEAKRRLVVGGNGCIALIDEAGAVGTRAVPFTLFEPQGDMPPSLRAWNRWD